MFFLPFSSQLWISKELGSRSKRALPCMFYLWGCIDKTSKPVHVSQRIPSSGKPLNVPLHGIQKVPRYSKCTGFLHEICNALPRETLFPNALRCNGSNVTLHSVAKYGALVLAQSMQGCGC